MAEREAPPGATEADSDGGDTKWLALALRQAFLLFISAVELRYGLKRRGKE